MDAEEQIARQRLSVLELAEALGNVAEACRQRDMNRSQFYEYKRRFQTHGLDGLKNLPPIPKFHPMTTPDEVVEKIIALSVAHPGWGCVRLSAMLKLDGVSVSSPTIQKILIKKGMGNRYDRLWKLEEKVAGHLLELSFEQVAFIEKYNPAFRERHLESSRPGELLCEDTFYVGRLKGVGRIYLHNVVDTFNSFAFGFLHTAKTPEAAIAVLHNDVFPFYRDKKMEVGAILTNNETEYCGEEDHPFERYLDLNNVEHRRARVPSPQTNGFVEQFNRTVLDEFFVEAFRKTFYETVEALQADLDVWLRYYNHERPHMGYRNMGKRPIDTINSFASPMQDEA